MIASVNIFLTISLALFQSNSGVWCMAIQQKRPLKTMGKLEAILSRNFRDTDSPATEEAATTGISKTEDTSEDGSNWKPSESVQRENQTLLSLSSEEAGADQTVSSTFVESLDTAHESGAEFFEFPASSVKQTRQKSTETEFSTWNLNSSVTGESGQAEVEEILEPKRRYSSGSEENSQTVLNATAKPVEDTTHKSDSELLGSHTSSEEPQKSTETEIATENLNIFTTGESRQAGLGELIETTRHYSSGSEEYSQTITNALIEPVEDTTHRSVSELLDVATSSVDSFVVGSVEPTTKESMEKESTTGNFSPSIIRESQQARDVVITEPTRHNSSSFQENGLTILNTFVAETENTGLKSNSELEEIESPASSVQSVTRESVENLSEGDSSRPIRRDSVTETIGGIAPKYSSGSQKTKVGKSVLEGINSTDIPATLPLAEASSSLANEFTLATEEGYAIEVITGQGFLYRKDAPEIQKESISNTNNPPLTDIKPLVTTENVKTTSQFVNESSPKHTEEKPRTVANATLLPLVGSEWNTTPETQWYEGMSSGERSVTNGSFPTGLPPLIEGLAKGSDVPWVVRQPEEESKAMEKKCTKANISCEECAKISKFCHYSHTERQCRYSNVEHGNEIYECGTRHFITDDFIPFYLSIATAGLATIGMVVYLSIEFYNRYYVKEAIPKEQTEELRNHLRLVREKRLKRHELAKKMGRIRLQVAMEGLEGECLLTEFEEDDDS